MGYVRTEFHEFGSNDIYIDDNGLYYIIPRPSLKEVYRLSKLKLTESQRRESSRVLDETDEQLKNLLNQ